MLQLQRASAGSGKTYTLAKKFIWFLITAPRNGGGRRLRTLREIADELPRILAITFTNKATNEMKQRIVEKLADMVRADGLSPVPEKMLKEIAYLKDFSDELQTAPENVGRAAKDALAVLLNNYSDFRVSTIDSFFQSVLRTFAYESNLNDAYQVEIDSDYLAAAAIDSTLDEINRDASSSSAARWIKTLMKEGEEKHGWNIFQKNTSNPHSIYSRLRNTIRKIDSEDFKEVRESLDSYFLDSEDEGRLEKAYAEIKKRIEGRLKAGLEEAQKEAAKLRDGLRSAGITPDETQRWLFNHIDKLFILDYNEKANSKRHFKPLALTGGKTIFKKGKERPGCEHLTATAAAMYDAYERWTALLSSAEGRLWECYAPLLPYLALLGEVRARMNTFLDANNMIQLGETNSMLRKIIGDDDAPFIYERLGSVINHYLIDEFQDTSRMQWENLYPLLRETDSRGEDNLIIGDAKQSIYRFRNADPSLISDVVPSLFPTHLAAGSSRADNTNWRSRRRIVEFNNLFFRFLTGRLAETGLGHIDFSNLYSNVAQYASKRAEEGYVEVRFIDPADYPEEREAGKSPGDIVNGVAIASVGPLISSMLDRGVPQREIAILVDTNKAGKDIIAGLVEYNSTLPPEARKIDFISEESLLVSQAQSVQIIVNVLRQIVDGYATIGRKAEDEGEERKDVKWNDVRASLDFYALRHPELTAAEQVAGFLNEDSRDNVIADMLADMQSVALPALVEAITEKFVPMDMRRSQAVFLAGFQDMVLDYTDRYAADVASFLSWWDSKGVLRSVSSPEGTDAVQIMTIHKAKGLEFKCVIIPLSFTSFTPDSKKSEWRWVKPSELFTEFDLPPFIPVETKPELLETEHAEEYSRYFDLHLMDRLNAVYVAFTRAVSELYIFARTDTKEGNLSAFLMDFASKPEEAEGAVAAAPEPDLLLSPAALDWNEGEKVLTVGLPPASYAPAHTANDEKEAQENPTGPVTRHLDDYKVDSSPKILHYVEEEAEDTSTLSPSVADNDPRSEGNLLHGIMEGVKVASDLPNAVMKMRMRGLLSKAQAEEWEPMLAAAIADPRAAKWFKEGWKVFNERDIIITNDKNRRPDRVMISPDGKRAIVVDYKFGTVPEDDSHKRQVREYMGLLRNDLHIPNVTGTIWYVREGIFANVGAFD